MHTRVDRRGTTSSSTTVPPSPSGQAPLQMQRTLGNRTTQQLLTSSTGPKVQRAPSPRLVTKLGKAKAQKVDTHGLNRWAEGLDDDLLAQFKTMPHTKFDGILTKVKLRPQTPQKSSGFWEWLGWGGGGVDLAGTVVETEEMAEGLVKTVDGGGELVGGLSSGIKDSIEGYGNLQEGKRAEGGLGLVGGVSGIGSALAPMLLSEETIKAGMNIGGIVPIPDVLGIVSGGTKALGGVVKTYNAGRCASAISDLRVKASGDVALATVCAALYNRVTYTEGLRQTTFGALEGGSSWFGGGVKWATQSMTKGIDFFANSIGSGLRFVGSSLHSSIWSTQQYDDDKRAGLALVGDVVAHSAATDVGWLARLAALVDPDFADEITGEAAKLTDPRKTEVAQQIEAFASKWP